MRNLKRALSLAMASVMLLGMMVVGTSAAGYSDVSSEQNQEAIEVLQAAGIMTGDENGNFNPAANVTRNEMAVVMCNLLDYTVSTYKGTAPFTDVPSWAEPYVAACYTNGIIAGYSDTTFGGNDPVTTGQAALMLLKALGYFKEAGDFGEDWLVETTKQGTLAGLFDDVDTGAVDALTRNDVAQLVLNALEADCVQVDSHDLVSDGKGGFTTKAVYAARTSTSDKYGKIDNEIRGGATRYTIQLGEDLYDGDLQKNANASDDFQRPATEWKMKNNTIGVYTDKPSATYTAKVTAANIYSVVGKSTADDLKNGDYALFNYVDGVGGQITSNINTYVDKNDTYKINNSGNGMLTEVYVDDTAETVTIVSINTYVFQASTDYNATKESVDVVSAGDTQITLADRTLSQDDFDVKNVKADDYLLITAAKQANGTYDVQSVQVAEVLSGAVSGYKVQDSVTIDGTTYKYSLTTQKNPGEQDTQYTVGQTAAVVLDAYGYIIAVDEAVVSSNYVYVSEFAQPSGLSNGKVVAHAYFTDGTTADITVKERLGSSIKSDIMGAADGDGKYFDNAGWYTYSKNSSDEYSLYAIEAKYGKTSISYDYGTADQRNVAHNNEVKFLANGTTTGVNGTAISANADTIIVVDDGDTVTVYTGVKNLPDITLQAATSDGAKGTANVAAVYKTSNKYAAYVFIATAGNTSISGGEDSNMIYFVKYDGQHRTTDNEIYYTYKVLVDGKEEIVKADSQIRGTGDIYSAYYKAKSNADEELTSVLSLPTSAGEKFIAGDSKTDPIVYSSGTLNVANKGYTLADNYQITLVTMKSAKELNKDKEADYEAQVVTAKELGDLLKGYTVTYNYELKATEKDGSELEQLFVTVTKAIPSDSNVAQIDAVTLNGKAVDVYTTPEAAYAKPISVPVSSTMTVAATGTGTMTYELQRDYTSGNFSGSTINQGSSQFSGTAGKVDVIKVTATPADSSKTVDRYFAVKTAVDYSITGVTVTPGSGKVTVAFTTATNTASGQQILVQLYNANGTVAASAVGAAANSSTSQSVDVALTTAGSYSGVITLYDTDGVTVLATYDISARLMGPTA